MVKPRGFTNPSIPITASTPRKGGSIIEKPKGSSFSAFTDPSSLISSTAMPCSTFFTRVEVIHLMR
ncbi:MAG: hypothetical protein R3D46_00660 [Defluviimonas denitrificans]